jgi:outer membrane protein TolC
MFRISFTLLLASAALVAAEPLPPSTPLSLDDAIRVAWQNDPHAAALALVPEIARAREVQVGLTPPPELDLRATLPATSDSEWTLGVGVSRTLIPRERLTLARAYARLGAETSTHQLHARHLALADTVRRLTYELAVNDARATAARRTLDSLHHLATTLTARHAAGEVADTDLDLLDLEIARAEHTLALATAESLGTRSRLRQHLRSPQADLAPSALDLANLLARPLPTAPAAYSPALALADLSQREAAAALALVQSESRPTWTLGAGLDLERRANDATGRLETTPLLGVNASRPWPGAVANRGLVLEKRADLHLAESRRAATAADLAAEHSASLAAATAAQPALTQHRALLDRAAALPAKLQAAFARGEITAPQLAQARQYAHAVEADFLTTAARYLALLADAEAAAGLLPTPETSIQLHTAKLEEPQRPPSQTLLPP